MRKLDRIGNEDAKMYASMLLYVKCSSMFVSSFESFLIALMAPLRDKIHFRY